MKQRHHFLIILFAPLLILGALATFAIAFQIRSVIRHARTLSALELRNAELKSNEALLGRFRAFVKEKESEVEKAETLFIDPETPIDFLSFLEKAAQSRGISLTITPGNPQKLAGDPWPSLEFQLAFRSPFPQALSFLRTVETGPYLLQIKGLTFAKSQTEQNQADTTLFLKAFTQP